uniref:Uncharacterized protein n=1 Tax=Meloidogyne enterolobii TaxID=390850 RepID=A0A6V7V607_MELEN|nr:unnamed protein product [Meloidogyne enterolobii]
MAVLVGFYFYTKYQEKQIRKTMTEEEYIMYREKKKALKEQRLKYGTDLYIPFLTKKVENERIDEIYYKS